MNLKIGKMKELKSIEVFIEINDRVLSRSVLKIVYRIEIWHGRSFR